MRTATILLGLALVAGCQQHRYFVDLDQATWLTDAGKRASVALQKDLDEKKRQVADAVGLAEKAEKAKLPDASFARAQATETAQRLQTQFDQLREATRAQLVSDLRPALRRLVLDRRVDAIESASSVAIVDLGADLTADLIRQANATAKASEVDALKAENERLKAMAKP
jgi:hypothetical protein